MAIDTERPASRAVPPRAERRPVRSIHHGRERIDDYAWLRADNWQEVMRDPARLDPAIRAHLEAENAWAAQALHGTEHLQEELFTEMRGRIREDDSSVPAPDGPYAYATRYVAGGQHPLIVRTPRDGGDEEVLIDADYLAADKAYFRLSGAGHSPDHRLMWYGSDETGSEYFTLRIRDLASGQDLEDVVPGTTGSAVWSADGRHLFYTWLDDNHRPRRVMRHRIGTPVEADTVVYEEHDPGFFVSVGRTQSRRFIVIDAHDHETSEIRLIEAADPEAAPRLIAARRRGVEYSVEHHGDALIILTNDGGAEDFRIVTAPLADPTPGAWRDLVSHRRGRLILEVAVYAGHLVRLEREDGLPRIVIHRFADGAEHAIAFDEEAYSLSLQHGYEFDTTTIRFSYSSMRTPAQVFDYDMESRARRLRKRQEVPSGHDPDDYIVRRLHAPAPDGESVPVSVLHHRDTPIDGTAPCLLYGYGAYGISVPAAFNTNWLSIVDRGLVFAIAHVRGGKEKGYHWYRDGKAARKTNTFTDFIAVAEHLAATGYTARGRIVAQGGSAGGMLMGAVANMAPELFLGIVAEVPFVDVLATMLDDSLPLTPPEWPEWGNPIESAEAYDTIASYSPYDNVAPLPYPHILALAGLTDPRVTYWEPAKWVARLRERSTSDNMILLRTNMDAGHAGAAGRFDRLKEIALIYAFVLKVTGKAGAPARNRRTASSG